MSSLIDEGISGMSGVGNYVHRDVCVKEGSIVFDDCKLGNEQTMRMRSPKDKD